MACIGMLDLHHLAGRIELVASLPPTVDQSQMRPTGFDNLGHRRRGGHWELRPSETSKGSIVGH